MLRPCVRSWRGRALRCAHLECGEGCAELAAVARQLADSGGVGGVQRVQAGAQAGQARAQRLAHRITYEVLLGQAA
jgi:hypothetical protein